MAAVVAAAAPQVLADESSRLANTTVARIVKAQGSLDDPAVLRACCAKLQKIDGELKKKVAEADALACHEAMKGGLTGLGCDHGKLIAALCSRTKASLQRTKAAYRAKYDKDLAKEVKSETSSYYARMMAYALAAPDEYVADVIHAACHGMGCDEEALIELCLTRSPEQLAAGKKCWEGRRDKSLFDYISKELGHEYRHLKYLILEILKGKRIWDGVPDEGRAADHAAKLKKECSKGMMQDFKEDKVVDWLLAGPPAEAKLTAEIYEKQYSKSLASALEKKCGKKFFLGLKALLMTPEEFVAMRLEKAMKGFGTSEGILIRLLGGLDHSSRPSLPAVLVAYESKYGRTLREALKSEISGNFLKASLAWIGALEDPAQQAEEKTGADPEACADPSELLDDLLVENRSVCKMLADGDAQAIYEACHGFGTSDTKLITLIASRSKPHLQDVARAYYAQRDGKSKTAVMITRLRQETSGWYKLLLTYLVSSPEDADVRMLDAAMDGIGADGLALIEFLVGHSQARVRAAKAKWEGKHDKSLVDRVRSELHGANEALALELLKGERPEGAPADATLAANQADQLHAGAKGWGTDETAFIQILAKNSPAQNYAIRTAYENKYNKSLEALISSEMSGNLAKCLQALLLPPADYFAMRLKQAFKGIGTSDRVVCRVLGGHDKVDAVAIAEAYQRKYTTYLKDAIKSECSGNYKRLAIAWITLPDALADPDAPIELPEVSDEPEKAPPPPEPEYIPEPPTPPYEPPPPPPYVPPPQPVAVARAPPQFMTVPVPQGVFPGMTVVVAAPSGQRLSVIVPQGVGPGMAFRVPLPAAPPPPMYMGY